MAKSIRWSFSTEVVDPGPKLNQAGIVPIESYQETQVPVPAGATSFVVNVPAGAQFLVVTASVPYPTGTNTLKYKINNAGADVSFTAPLLLFGSEVVTRFAGGSLTSLAFSNPGAKEVTVGILAALDVTPNPPAPPAPPNP